MADNGQAAFAKAQRDFAAKAAADEARNRPTWLGKLGRALKPKQLPRPKLQLRAERGNLTTKAEKPAEPEVKEPAAIETPAPVRKRKWI